MKRKAWMCLALLVIVPAMLFTAACGKKAATDADTATKMEPAKAPAAPAVDPKAEAEKRAKEMALNEFLHENVNFEFDSAVLTAMGQQVLQRKAAWLNANPSASVTIEGHCDERGTNEYNLALGERRAASAKAFLVDLGIAAARLKTVSYGEERPLDPASTEEAWAKNRRAQFKLN
jgi:peptidoglycan-associated lipoprotein